MGRFRNLATGVVVSVDDSKDARFSDGFEPVKDGAAEKKAPAKKAAAPKTEK